MTFLVALMLAAAPTTAGPRPPPELAQLKFFEGPWKCDTKVSAPEGGERAVKSKVTVKIELDRFWLTVQMSEQKAKDYPFPHATDAFWGYDLEGQQFTRMGVGNRGDWENATSTGWSGDDLIWTGTITRTDGQRVPYRHSVTRNGPRNYADKVELNAGGEWHQIAQGKCEKP